MPSTILLSDNGATSGISGYHLTGGTDGTLTIQTTTSGGTPTTAMLINTSQNVGIGTSSPSYKMHVYDGTSASIVASTPASDVQIAASSSGFGLLGTVGNYPLVMRTNGTERARIDTSGNLLVGTTTVQEKLTVNGFANFNGSIYTLTDNSYSCGVASRRWSVVYAATGAINTSDAREKTVVASLNQSEINAAKQFAAEIGSYKWLAAIEEKGDAARTHIGMTVQRAIEIMEANGLVPFDYGFICYDEWQDKFVKDEDGNDVLAVAAGNRFSFRMDELNLFIARGQQAAIQEQQAIIEQLRADVAALKAKA